MFEKINPLKKKIENLGFRCKEINGHNFNQLYKNSNLLSRGKIDCLILNTVKGKGFKIMENDPKWHY